MSYQIYKSLQNLPRPAFQDRLAYVAAKAFAIPVTWHHTRKRYPLAANTDHAVQKSAMHLLMAASALLALTDAGFLT
jgi:hypothetical protein